MKKILMMSLLLAISNVHAEGLWNKIKQGASDAGNAVVDGAKSITEKTPPEEVRAEIDQMEKSAIENLYKASPYAREQMDSSYGYAVFDNRKFSFMITTEYGAGVAVERSGKRTYMKMASGGVNIGLGGEFYQIVFLFQNKGAFDKFVNDGYDFGSEATATGGTESARTEVRFVNGVAIYKLDSKGLKLTLDLTGTKYWKDDELNQ